MTLVAVFYIHAWFCNIALSGFHLKKNVWNKKKNHSGKNNNSSSESEKKRTCHVGRFIILLDQSSSSCENAPKHTDADAINPAAVLFNTDDQENCTLSKHCGAWVCYIKARRYDKALTDQIRGDLQLVPFTAQPCWKELVAWTSESRQI